MEVVATVIKVVNAEEVTTEEQVLLEASTGLSLAELREELAEPELDEDMEELEIISEAPSGPTIMLTTLVGSKGLQAQYVFVVGVNEGSLPRNNSSVKEQEVCEMLVALTRARKSCTFVSCRNFAGNWLEESIFVSWLKPLIEDRAINKKTLTAAEHFPVDTAGDPGTYTSQKRRVTVRSGEVLIQ